MKKIKLAALLAATVLCLTACDFSDTPAPSGGVSGGSQTSGTSTGSVDESVDDWIARMLSAATVSVSEKDAAKWKSYPESDFFSAWSSYVYENIQSQGNDYFSKVKYLKKVRAVYEGVYGTEGALIDTISANIDEMDKSLAKSQVYIDRFDLTNVPDTYSWRKFYVNQRLEKAYSDTILGILEKELDNLKPKDSVSDWVAYDVVYALGSPYPGDECFVIHSNEQDPFPKEGEYYLAYYETGATIELKDSKGFVREVPVYHLMGDADEVNNAMSEIEKCFDEAEVSYNIILLQLSPDNAVTDADKTDEPDKSEVTDATDAPTSPSPAESEDGVVYAIGLLEKTIGEIKSEYELTIAVEEFYMGPGAAAVSFSDKDGRDWSFNVQ